ncbi:MAG: hypothetical protein V7K19_05985, partial [Nostoc sp.]
MNKEQQRRLEERRDKLQQDWDIRSEKVKRIRRDLAIRPVRKFKKQSVSGLGMVSVKARVNGIIRAR